MVDPYPSAILVLTNKPFMNQNSTDFQGHIDELEAKIKFLQDLLNSMQQEQNLNCSIELGYSSGFAFFIEQEMIPFNLSLEMKMLVAASIDHYQRVLNNLRGS